VIKHISPLSGDVLARQHDLARRGRQFTGDHVEGGGFSGTIRADQTHDRALFNLEIHAAHGMQTAKALGQA